MRTVTPTGFEQSPQTSANTTAAAESGNQGGNGRASDTAEAAELWALFQAMDDAARRDLLAIARGLGRR